MKIVPKSFRNLMFLVVLLIPPVSIIIKHYAIQNSFLSMIYFGQKFKATRLEEINNVDPPTVSAIGYDGQFYAQMAIDPFLSRDDLERAMDNPVYRSRRIGLPFLAYCLGLGKPEWILQAYSLLNFAFWMLLLVALSQFIGFRHPKDVLLVIAVLWSTGTLVSIARALPDLPAAVLGVLAIFLHHRWILAAFLLGGSALFKETSALSFAAASWYNDGKRRSTKCNLMSVMIMTVPIVLWVVYVHVRISTGAFTQNNSFAFPLLGFIQKIWEATHDLLEGFPQSPIFLRTLFVFEVLSPLCLAVQATYLILKPRFEAAAWRLGIGFALLFCLLGRGVWADLYAYCRVFLPLTFSFNLLLHKYETGIRYAAWYLAGNIAMSWMLLLSALWL